VFDGSKSTSRNSKIISYEWDFGDHTPMLVGVSVSHTYERKGTYRASLTVRDEKGLKDSAYLLVMVTVEPFETGVFTRWREYRREGTSSCEGPAPDASGKHWYEPGYDDAAWSRVQLYEGLSLGSNSQSKDYFYRTPLTMTPEQWKRARIRMLIFHDDAFWLWVNGKQVPASAFDNPGEAGCHEELGRFKTHGFITRYLHEGLNTLALHLTSGDNRAGEPYIAVYFVAIYD
jgi:PKD repeat protein